MRGVWTQAHRPRLRGPRHLSHSDSLTSTLVRKTTNRPPRPRHSLSQHVFTVLLTPVLAAALFVDTSWKAKQRRDWDERLAVINDEINQLKERERRLKSSISFRNSRSILYQQRRSYGTAAGAVAETEDDRIPEDIPIPFWEEEPSDEQNAGAREEDALDTSGLKGPEFSPQELSDVYRFHRLNAIILALRMMLHLRIGENSFFLLSSGDNPFDLELQRSLDESSDTDHPESTYEMVKLLFATKKQLRRLHLPDRLHQVSFLLQVKAHQGHLRHTIGNLTEKLVAEEINPVEYVEASAQAILHSSEVPCTKVFTTLMEYLSKFHNEGVAYLVAGALKYSSLPLNDPAIFHLLRLCGLARDSRSFQFLLAQVVRPGSTINVARPWQNVKIGDMVLPAPRSLNPRLLNILVFAALRCSQTERAEAWLGLIRETDYGDSWKHHVFRSFLAFYSYHCNWERGKKWLQRSIDHAVSIASHSIDDLAFVISRMLDLCVRCQKLPIYTAILDAAVEAGIAPPPISRSALNAERFNPRRRSYLLEWKELSLPENTEGRSVKMMAQSFQSACLSWMPELLGTPERPEDMRLGAAEDDLALQESKDRFLRQRYALRLRAQAQGADEPGSAQKIAALQDQLAQQAALVAEMSAKMDLASRRQQSHEQEIDARSQKWIKDASWLGDEVRDILIRIKRLKAQEKEQEAMIAELRLRSTVAGQPSTENIQQADTSANEVAKMTQELREVKREFEQLKIAKATSPESEKVKYNHVAKKEEPPPAEAPDHRLLEEDRKLHAAPVASEERKLHHIEVNKDAPSKVPFRRLVLENGVFQEVSAVDPSPILVYRHPLKSDQLQAAATTPAKTKHNHIPENEDPSLLEPPDYHLLAEDTKLPAVPAASEKIKSIRLVVDKDFHLPFSARRPVHTGLHNHLHQNRRNLEGTRRSAAMNRHLEASKAASESKS